MNESKGNKHYNIIAAVMFLISSVQGILTIRNLGGAVGWEFLLKNPTGCFALVLFTLSSINYVLFSVFIFIKKPQLIIIPIAIFAIHNLLFNNNITLFISYLVAGFVWLATLKKIPELLKSTIRRIFWLPSVIYFLSIVISNRLDSVRILLLDIQTPIFIVAGLFFMFLWIAYPNGFEKDEIENIAENI